MAVIDGMDSTAALAFVRHHYDSRAAETPWQERYIRTFTAAGVDRRGREDL
jgi:hypothetical protein